LARIAAPCVFPVASGVQACRGFGVASLGGLNGWRDACSPVAAAPRGSRHPRVRMSDAHGVLGNLFRVLARERGVMSTEIEPVEEAQRAQPERTIWVDEGFASFVRDRSAALARTAV